MMSLVQWSIITCVLLVLEYHYWSIAVPWNWQIPHKILSFFLSYEDKNIDKQLQQLIARALLLKSLRYCTILPGEEHLWWASRTTWRSSPFLYWGNSCGWPTPSLDSYQNYVKSSLINETAGVVGEWLQKRNVWACSSTFLSKNYILKEIWTRPLSLSLSNHWKYEDRARIEANVPALAVL